MIHLIILFPTETVNELDWLKISNNNNCVKLKLNVYFRFCCLVCVQCEFYIVPENKNLNNI